MSEGHQLTCDIFPAQVLLQRGVVRLSATGDHRHVGTGRPQEEAQRPADSAEPRDPERRAHHQLRAAFTLQIGSVTLTLLDYYFVKCYFLNKSILRNFSVSL